MLRALFIAQLRDTRQRNTQTKGLKAPRRPDTFIVNGTSDNDSIPVGGKVLGVSALGLAAQVNITGV